MRHSPKNKDTCVQSDTVKDPHICSMLGELLPYTLLCDAHLCGTVGQAKTDAIVLENITN